MLLCCDCGGCSLACDCTDSDCFQLDSPPTWAACGSNADALTLIEEAYNGVLRKHASDSCSWWSSACGGIGTNRVAGYAVELRLDLAACNWVLEFYQACDILLEDCCNGLNDPPSADPNVDWTLIARYTWDQSGTFNCESGANSFDLADDNDGCSDCADGGVDVTWPSTLELTAGVTCDSSEPGRCDDSVGTDCCGLHSYSGTLNVHLESSCAGVDGLDFTLTKHPTLPIWIGGEVSGSRCGNLCYVWDVRLVCTGTGGSPPINAAVTLICDGGLGGNCGGVFAGSGAGGADYVPPVAVQCEPFAAVFIRNLVAPTGTDDCGTCEACDVTLTFTF